MEIERYKHQMAMASYANQTIKHALNCISGAIKHAKRMGYNVADDLQMPVVRLPKGRLRYLSVEEEQRLLKVIDPKRRGSATLRGVRYRRGFGTDADRTVVLCL